MSTSASGSSAGSDRWYPTARMAVLRAGCFAGFARPTSPAAGREAPGGDLAAAADCGHMTGDDPRCPPLRRDRAPGRDPRRRAGRARADALGARQPLRRLEGPRRGPRPRLRRPAPPPLARLARRRRHRPRHPARPRGRRGRRPRRALHRRGLRPRAADAPPSAPRLGPRSRRRRRCRSASTTPTSCTTSSRASLGRRLRAGARRHAGARAGRPAGEHAEDQRPTPPPSCSPATACRSTRHPLARERAPRAREPAARRRQPRLHARHGRAAGRLEPARRRDRRRPPGHDGARLLRRRRRQDAGARRRAAGARPAAGLGRRTPAAWPTCPSAPAAPAPTSASSPTRSARRSKPVCDLVLVDAPCSGTGAWRRKPEGKWRLTPEELDRLPAAAGRDPRRRRGAGKAGRRASSTPPARCSPARTRTRAAAFAARHPGWRAERHPPAQPARRRRRLLHRPLPAPRRWRATADAFTAQSQNLWLKASRV